MLLSPSRPARRERRRPGFRGLPELHWVRKGPSESSPLAIVRRRSPAPRGGREGGLVTRFWMRPQRRQPFCPVFEHARPLKVPGGDTAGDLRRAPETATPRTALP